MWVRPPRFGGGLLPRTQPEKPARPPGAGRKEAFRETQPFRAAAALGQRNWGVGAISTETRAATTADSAAGRERELLRVIGAEVALLREYLAWRQAAGLLPTPADIRRLRFWHRLALRYGQMLPAGHPEGCGDGE